jgi:SAM-dependent methyltransferase
MLLLYNPVMVRADNTRIKIISVDCPLCGSKEKKPLYRNLTDVEDGIPGIYTISRCSGCGLIYLSTRPSEKSLPECYRRDYHVRVESRRKIFSRFLYGLKHKHDAQLVQRIIGHTPKSLIDIGCGSGGFLMELRRRWGKRCRLAGIDLAAPVSDDLVKAGIDLYIGSLERMRPVRQFDLVTLNEVLEHVYNPVKALRAASGWLKNGGFLIGEVPHFNSPWRKIFPYYWQGFQIPRHLTHFDEKTMTMVLQAAGYEVRSMGNRFNPGDISVSLCSLIVNRLAPGTRSRQSWLYIPLMVLTAPLSLFMYYFVHAPAILEFVAVKRK